MNLLTEVQKGLEGRNKGLKSGMTKLDERMLNIQKESIDLWGGRPKTNKTTIVDYRYILSPFVVSDTTNVRWVYFSYEISRIQKEARFASFFMKVDHGVNVDGNIILGRGDNRLPKDYIPLVERVYEDRIIPLFGEFDEFGKRLSKGKIDFIEDRDNPTGIRNYLLHRAEEYGTFHRESYTTRDNGRAVNKKRIVGYTPDDPDLHHIIMLDHVGLMRGERGYTNKQNVDKMMDYACELRNWCKYTFVYVSQFNRGMGSTDRLKFSGEQLQPTIEDFKETGNMVETANNVYAVFRPSEFAHLRNKSHLGYDLSILGDKYRSVHVLAARDVPGLAVDALLVHPGNNMLMELPNSKSEINQLNDIYVQIRSVREENATSTASRH